MTPTYKLVCCLPARNAAADLDGYFASVVHFADAVVALDDGSTDGTYDRLLAEPTVAVLLRNPERDGYKRWNDSANRQQLLDAAGSLDPQWVVWLDADERIDAGDAEALRRLIEVADSNCVYCFQVFRVRPSLTSFDQAGPFVCRLFAYREGLLLPRKRLHFPIAPTSVPPERWLYTPIRIQHLGGSTHARRVSRYEKYQEADPERRYQASYEHLLDDDGPPIPWRPLDPRVSLILGSHADLRDEPENQW